MASKKNPETSTEPSSEASPAKAKAKKKKPADGTRETVESIAIAFVLAFLFKTFQAEAYVIPTGSMAPTLFGRHKEVQCDGCGFKFALGASSEVDQSSGRLDWRITTAYCSNCGKQNNNVADAPVFNGDRILVNKQIDEFKRFDVVVFKNPEQPHVNYIKRLVGLPGETIRIRQGNLWGLSKGEDSWKILRKDDPFIQKDIQLTVYDDNFPAPTLLELGWPERWAASAYGSGNDSVGNWRPVENSWTADANARTYRFDNNASEAEWLRYRNFQPHASTWPRDDQVAPDLPMPQASLITDFCSFNAYDAGYNQGGNARGYWVGDLTINASIELERIEADSELILELVDGPQTFRCVVSLSDGTANLEVVSGDNREATTPMASGKTAMSSTGTYDVTFANVDDRICLWVNNKLIEFDASTEYTGSDVPQPTGNDLAPVGIAIRNATGIASDLLLQRDIYYRNDLIQFDVSDGICVNLAYENNYRRDEVNSQTHNELENDLDSQLTNPAAWAASYAKESAVQISSFGKYGEYELADDEYLMFGDNSSMSKDSRLFDYEARPMNGIFSHRYAVREKDLIGKALFIFWPHGVPFLNDGKGIPVWYHKTREGKKAEDYPSFRIPFYPNLTRMKKIR
ncbi:MAG: signal peptidase I [Fuerstiella sp.]